MCTVAQGRQLLRLQGCKPRPTPPLHWGRKRKRGCSQCLDGPQGGEGPLGKTLDLVVVQGEQREVLQVLEGVGPDAVDLVGIQKPAGRDSWEVKAWQVLSSHTSCTILAPDTGDLRPLHTAFSFPDCMLTLQVGCRRAQRQRGFLLPTILWGPHACTGVF